MSQTNSNENIISIDLEANTQENQHNQENQEIQRKLDENLAKLQQITSILKKTEQTSTYDDNMIIRSAKICGVTLVVLLLGPLSIASLYYAYTDNSCVHESAGQLAVNLFTYLVVDGIMGGAGIIGFSTLICCLSMENYTNMLSSCCGILLMIICQLFQLAWTIVGSVIFWKLIDNNNCDKGVYNYVFALLIIKYVMIFMNCMLNNNNKKNKK